MRSSSVGSVDSGYYSPDTNESFQQTVNEDRSPSLVSLKANSCKIDEEEDFDKTHTNAIKHNQSSNFYETFDQNLSLNNSNKTVLNSEAALQYLSILKQQKNNTQIYVNINGKYVSVGEVPLLFVVPQISTSVENEFSAPSHDNSFLNKVESKNDSIKMVQENLIIPRSNENKRSMQMLDSNSIHERKRNYIFFLFSFVKLLFLFVKILK